MMDQNQMQQGVPTQGVPQNIPQGFSENGTSQMPSNGSQLISDEQKRILMDLIQQIKGKLSSLEATRFASKDGVDSMRKLLLSQVFEKLQLAGVDLTDRNSIADFLARLQQKNPELAAMFEESIGMLLGDQGGVQPEAAQDPNAIMAGGVPPQNNMNNEINPNETIPQNIQ